MMVLSSLSCRPPCRHHLAQSPPSESPARIPAFRAVSCARVSHAPLPRAALGLSLRHFVYSIQMTRLPAYILLLALFLLAACNGEKEFMTPKPNEIVVDVNVNEYSLNGIVIGKTSEVSNNADLIIKPFDSGLKKVRQSLNDGLKNNQSNEEIKVKIHLDDNLTYDEFYKFITTLGFNGFTSIRYVIGSNFKDVYTLFLLERRDSCRWVKNGEILRPLKGNLNLTDDEIREQRIKEQAILEECARNNLDLSLSVQTEFYNVGLNESGLVGGTKIYTFNRDDDLWNLIDDIRSRTEFRDKDDRNKIVLVFEKGLMMKKATPIIKKLTEYGYAIAFAISGV